MSKARKNDDFDVNVGNNLRELRTKQSMSQQELGDKLNVTRTAVCHWESGERALYFSTAKEICKILNCKLDDLIK